MGIVVEATGGGGNMVAGGGTGRGIPGCTAAVAVVVVAAPWSIPAFALSTGVLLRSAELPTGCGGGGPAGGPVDGPCCGPTPLRRAKGRGLHSSSPVWPSLPLTWPLPWLPFA